MTQDEIISQCTQYIANQQREIAEVQAGQWDERIAMWNSRGNSWRDRQSMVELRHENISDAQMAIEDAGRGEAIACPECGKGRSVRTRCWSCGYPA